MSRNRKYGRYNNDDDGFSEGYEYLKKKLDNRKKDGIRKFRKNREDY